MEQENQPSSSHASASDASSGLLEEVPSIATMVAAYERDIMRLSAELLRLAEKGDKKSDERAKSLDANIDRLQWNLLRLKDMTSLSSSSLPPASKTLPQSPVSLVSGVYIKT